ncbi:fructan beta-fructosidase [Paenibacillus sp. UNCCL117]|uniref:GH32 C-terminal domain-containing protein n=1 Tax=unclassified Paenibacillus TaxID=185978 RepID=UPI0008886D08|nr:MULTISPECIES: GH32 C-terminal domain-containing protein [unclassified Paenibacillus]SDE19493.1 levanase [Paenibacillus sp. cl123]SFW61997.1 fructan beta-fructosidase [Paenibacillus sp. UNCCL117]
MKRNGGKGAWAGALLMLGMLTSACTGEDGGKAADRQGPENPESPAFAYNTDPLYYTELYRPQYHLSPPTGNLSDPNGMVYFEGEYHQFYQNSGQWGHAVSTDLLHWEHLPVALARDPLGEIWSGSAVVDWKDTSGFFGGKAGLVAIFTHFKSGQQSQSIAYSKDKGRTWTKYEGNPVIPNPGLKDFRDPKVIWHEPTRSWVMVVSVDRSIQFYTSQDLKSWKLESEFGAGHGSHAAVWECPDLFELPVEGTNLKKWVLAVSIGSNPATKGSTAQYFVGSFDGKTFQNENAPTEVLWADYGKDFYAAVSYSDIPAKDGRRIWTGWMSNWRYPFAMPTEPWKGNLSIPRELRLRDIPGTGLRLVQHPVKELEKLRGEAVKLSRQQLAPGVNPLQGLKGTSYELETEFTVSPGSRLELKVRKGADEETVIRYDAAAEKLAVDRRRSGAAAFEAGFAEVMEAPLKLREEKVKLRLFVDESTLEVFANDGEAVISSLIFPGRLSHGLELTAAQGGVTLEEARFYPLQTVWRDEKAGGLEPLRIVFDQSAIDVPVGQTRKLAAAVLPLTASQEVKWESSDPAVAMVTAEGGTSIHAKADAKAEVTGLKAGEAEIRAVTGDGKVAAVLNVFVFEAK